MGYCIGLRSKTEGAPSTYHAQDSKGQQLETRLSDVSLGAYFLAYISGDLQEPFDVRLVGMENRAIDGGLSIQEPSAHVWLKGIEIMVSEPTPENPVDPEALTLEADLIYMVGRIASISTS